MITEKLKIGDKVSTPGGMTGVIVGQEPIGEWVVKVGSDLEYWYDEDLTKMRIRSANENKDL